ncbi:MAG: glucose dehydrogenase [Bacteroidia bacterium]|nr:glucose dehydrogenase [Bacteroidia bacterium]
MSAFKYVFGFLIVTVLGGYFFFQNGSEYKPINSSYSINLQLVTESLVAPVAAASPLDGTNRLFVCEQPGRIRVIESGKLLSEVFLDLGEKVDKLNFAYSEKGLIGLVFHPDYKTNGKFYVHYSSPEKRSGINHTSVVSEFTVSDDKNIANTDEKIILTLGQPESNHNGGPIVFGPDGYLYISFGDGGGAGDKHGTIGNGQDLNTWLGKIIRIDVDRNKPFAIPDDNPFIGQNAKPEIFAYGLRNPWGMSFDKDNGTFFAADVGQNKFEEINIIEKGGNYGWRIMEANHCYNPSENCNEQGLVLPINEYDHDTGISVAGGYVYRGDKIESLKGQYIFGDWTGKIFSLKKINNNWLRHNVTTNTRIKGYLNAFGEDEEGNIYVLTQNIIGPKSKSGKVYKITN